MTLAVQGAMGFVALAQRAVIDRKIDRNPWTTGLTHT